ncbi:MAG TPA: hypothetical protein VJ691_18495 [Vicinamibacterales bacterium]|nr:hypothetical protein [Vicinamibacterales bacterium]
MPRMRFTGDHHNVENARRQQLLAVRPVWRGLERRSPQRDTWSESAVVTHADLVRELHELIAALDRRVPCVERAGEAAIARDAALLREKAVKRLRELADTEADASAAGSNASFTLP